MGLWGGALALLGGCTCATPPTRDAPPSPDVTDPLEPCALGIRRAAMDLPLGTDRVAVANVGERLFMADVAGLVDAPLRVSELTLEGTRIALTEVTLESPLVATSAVLILPGEPLSVWLSAEYDAAHARLGTPPSVVLLEPFEWPFAVDGGDGTALTVGEGTVSRRSPDGTVVDLELDVVGARTWALTPADSAGRGHGAAFAAGELVAFTYDFGATPPRARVIDVGVPMDSTSLAIARTASGVVISGATPPEEGARNLRTVWLDESLAMIAQHDQVVEAWALRPLGIVSGPYGELIAFSADGGLRVMVSDAPGVVRGGHRALVVDMLASSTDGATVISAIEGSISVVLQRRGLVEVVTLCAPL